MCIGVWTLDHPDYALIVGQNRDEFIDRPTQDAHWHSFEDVRKEDSIGNILSGRDAAEGGSWFGVNKAGRIALLTNISGAAAIYGLSRGHLISSFLRSDSSHPLEDELGKIIPPNAVFAGFNLLLLAPRLGDGGRLSYDTLFVTNHDGGGTITSRQLSSHERRCGCVSNGVDGKGADEWPKVKRATGDFAAAIKSISPEATYTEIAERLFKVLAWRSAEPVTQRSDLRNTVQVEPIPILLGRALVPAVFGTRLSTVLLIRRNGEAHLIERDVWKRGNDERVVKTDPPTQREFQFMLDLEAIRRPDSASSTPLGHHTRYGRLDEDQPRKSVFAPRRDNPTIRVNLTTSNHCDGHAPAAVLARCIFNLSCVASRKMKFSALSTSLRFKSVTSQGPSPSPKPVIKD